MLQLPMIYEHAHYKPQIDRSCYIAPNAAVIGQVTLDEEVNIWYGATVRADVNTITIGRQTNIQDNAVLHVTRSHALTIQERCTIGHGAIVHAAVIGAGSLVGMGAIILDGAVIGERSLVAAGSVVPPNKSYPPRSLILGSPATVVRSLTDEEIEEIERGVNEYLLLARQVATVVDTGSY